MGSRVLSRSFNVTRWTGETEDDAPEEVGTPVTEASMDVDDRHDSSPPDESELAELAAGDDSDDDDDDVEDPSDVAMVPMADMLNARWESENVGNQRARCA